MGFFGDLFTSGKSRRVSILENQLQIEKSKSESQKQLAQMEQEGASLEDRLRAFQESNQEMQHLEQRARSLQQAESTARHGQQAGQGVLEAVRGYLDLISTTLLHNATGQRRPDQELGSKLISPLMSLLGEPSDPTTAEELNRRATRLATSLALPGPRGFKGSKGTGGWVIGGEGAKAAPGLSSRGIVGGIIGGTTLGQGAKELGLGPVAELIGETAGSALGAGLGSLGKSSKTAPSYLTPEEKELFNYLLQTGQVSSEDLATIFSPKSAKVVASSPLFSKGYSRQKVQKAQKGINKVYDKASEGADEVFYPVSRYQALSQKFEKAFEKMHSDVQEAVGSDLKSFREYLRTQSHPGPNAPSTPPVTLDMLMRKYRGINESLANRKMSRRWSDVREIKDILVDAMKEIDPSRAKEFAIANKLHGSLAPLARALSGSKKGFGGLIEVGKPVALAIQALKTLLHLTPGSALALTTSAGIYLLPPRIVLNPAFRGIVKKAGSAATKTALIKVGTELVAFAEKEGIKQPSEEETKETPKEKAS